MKSIFDKMSRKGAGEWLMRINPIARLSISEARAIYDAARAYGSPRLQKIYDEIELTDPVLMTCVERRDAALAGLGWKVTKRGNADATLADEQADAADAFLANIDNLTAALVHLDLGFFRGFSHVQPLWDGNRVDHIALLENWNFLTADDGTWLWNPEAVSDPNACTPITRAARLVSCIRRRAIDYPALTIYIRKALGEQDWGRFIERYGIPPVDVVMAPNTTEKQEAKYVESAESARDGNPVVWPSGTTTSRAEGSRGQDPFTAFIEHQEKLIVLSATGGTLTSLAQADTGSLAGGAQMDVWEQIVARDAVVISDAINRSLVRPFLEAAFPGRGVAVDFAIGHDKEQSPQDVANLAATLKQAGWSIDQGELQEAVGYTLTKDEVKVEGQGQGFPFAAGRAGAPRTPQADDPKDILASFVKDNGPAAEAIRAFLKNPGKEAAAALQKRLPDLIPEDPAMAAVIAEEMAKEFGKTETAAAKIHLAAASGTSEGAKKGWETRRRNGWSMEQAQEFKAKICDLGDSSLSDPNYNGTVELGKISGDVVGDIKAATGVDVDGFQQEVSAQDIRHAYQNHGMPHVDRKGRQRGEYRAEQLPIGKGDFARITDVYSSYDTVEKGSDERNSGQTTIRYKKRFGDGTLVCVEVIATKHRKLRFKDAWKEAPAK